MIGFGGLSNAGIMPFRFADLLWIVYNDSGFYQNSQDIVS